MLTDQQAAFFQANGYFKGNRVLSDTEVEELRAELERVIRDKDKGGRQPVLLRNFSRTTDTVTWQIVDIWMASKPFERLVYHPEIVADAARLSGAKQLRLWHDQIQYKIAEKGGVNMWHQDWPYWQVLNGPHQVTAWVALDDVNVDNGCMSMVPGSHAWGRQIDFLHTLKHFDALPAEFDGHRLERKFCPVGKGEVHFHHGLTWHGSHANTSGRPRRAIALHYMTEQTRFVASGEHVMKPHIKVADGAMLEGDAFPLVWPR
jgi:ectoine hydroxylase-related dioxygenase (phytanoyl-CoA dioxygenase family)